jgi:hypothetical protein
MVYLSMLRLMLARLAKAAAKQPAKANEQKAACLFVHPLLIFTQLAKV